MDRIKVRIENNNKQPGFVTHTWFNCKKYNKTKFLKEISELLPLDLTDGQEIIITFSLDAA